MSDTTTTRAKADPATTTDAGSPALAGRRLRLPGIGRGKKGTEDGMGGSGGGSQLFRNAYALMLNTGISGVLGVGFWLAAAHYYTADAVGQGSAAIAAMKFLAGLTAVTLTGALARFIPVAGRATGRFIFRTYAGSSVAVAFAALIFLLTLDVWGPSYSFLHGTLNGLGFIAAVIAWSLLTLQDGVLTGLRSALWVPVGNTVFSLVKLGLLVAFAASFAATGVFVSWVVAIAFSVVPLGLLVFRRLVPRHIAATDSKAEPPSLREMGRFLAGDYTGSLFSLAVVYLVPVLIASQVSSADNAYFYIATTIGGTVNLLAINMGASLTVEGSHDPAQLAANTRAALRRMARIMLPICALLFILAPFVLHVFGAAYADAATPLLRWFAVGAALRVVMETYFAVLRAQSRTSGLAWLQGLLCLLVLGLTLLLLPRMGLTGAGVAEISSLAVIVAIAAPKLWRVVRAAPATAPPEDAPRDGDLADLGTPKMEPATKDGPKWALRDAMDSDTLQLAVQLNLDHQERRPDIRPGPVTPPAGTRRPTWVTTPPSPPAAASASVPASAAASASQASSDIRGEDDSTVLPDPYPEAVDLAFDTETGFETESDLESDFESDFESEPGSGPSAEPDSDPDPAAPARPAQPAERPRLTPTVVVLALLLVAAIGLYWGPVLGMGEADLDRMGGLGLISVLPPVTLLGAALLIGVFASLLWLERPHKRLLLLTLLATVVSLHALPAVIEAEPRFATAWQHLGFMDYIDRTGSAVPDLDARWSWPGFFAAAAFLAKACGVNDLTEVIRWWPTAIQLLYLAPMFLLLRSVRASWRAKWTGVWIFVLSGWVGQDYFSPQGFTYLLYLVFVAILLVYFRAPRMLWSKRRPGETEVAPTDRRQRAVLLVVLIALFAATVPAHQLTPFVMLGVLAVLVVVGRSELRGLPLLFGVIVVVWLGFLAEPYWSGHFNDLFGGIGGVGGNVTSSVSGRIQDGSSSHKLVLYTRVLLAGSVLAFACWGWWRRRDWKYRERSLLVLAFVPFLGFGMQSYGGEMALRVFMFALPGVALLAGLALFPRTGVTAKERDKDRISLAPLAALMAGLVLMGGFLVARWGNEPFERIRPGEVAAMDYVYTHDDPTVRLLWMSNDTVENVTPSLPWGARDMEKVQYVPTLAPVDPVLVGSLVKALKDAGPNSYLMLNKSQVVYLQMDVGYSKAWPTRLVENLDRREELKKVYVNADVTMYQLRKEPPGPVAKAEPGPIGPQITWTPWSLVGALAAAALIVLLTAREVVRVALRPSVRQLQWLQSTFWFSLPLLAVVLASLIQRFITMGLN
ncbi:lipopolysaccharide biosynthesis protein [Streptomyces sp. NBC_00006]|uniref:lipopolysaccharide biosynthesis protein n=1 Tax=Streptomyces sp. NBC_00006 TaxID=2975619 RepID=UPI00224E5D23|nr:lipopolysaccharide biosynthesis protein [Streptomyces sp. NBC_00006]MCX5534501.1 lipopolysaccharide biosynthesis protein [Streptomyces sp. NBC_00006]